MTKRMTKTQMAAELGRRADIPAARAAAVVDALVEIAYREAHNGFRIPGLCTLEVVERRPRRCRNPRDGSLLEVGAHKSLRIRATRKARNRVAPRPPGLVNTVDAQQQPAPEPIAHRPAGSTYGSVTFVCPHCRQEIEADGDMVGVQAPCPGCSRLIEVPAYSRPARPITVSAGGEGINEASSDVRSSTIRIELPGGARG